MKKWFLSVLVVFSMTSCVPSVDIGAIASNAANQAIETAVESAVDTLIRRTVDRLVSNLFDVFIAGAIDGLFAGGADVEYGPNFNLDLFTGQYDVTIEGDSPLVGRFSFEGGEPAENQDDFSVGVGLRGQDDEGNEFLTVGLIRVEETEATNFTLSLVEGKDDAGQPISQIGLSFNDDDLVYVGEAAFTIDSLTATRLKGSLTASGLMSEDGQGNISVNAQFDVPINPAGSLFFKALEVN